MYDHLGESWLGRLRERFGGLPLLVKVLVTGGVLLAVLIPIALVAPAQGGTSSEPQPTAGPAIGVTGSLPAQQLVGQPFTTVLHVHSISASIDYLVLDASGCNDHWVINDVALNGQSVDRTEAGAYYRMTGLYPDGTKNIRVTLTPKDVGNHACEFAFYPKVDDNGYPDGDELDFVRVDVAINP